MGEKEIVEDGPEEGTGGVGPGGAGTPGGGKTGDPPIGPSTGGGSGSGPGVQPGGAGTTQSRERPDDPCKDLNARAQALLAELDGLHSENREKMQRALKAFFGDPGSKLAGGYAHSFTQAKVTEAVVDSNNAVGKTLIDVALFAAGGWGSIAGKGSTAAGILGEGVAGAKTVGDAWGKVGVKVAGKVADAYIGDKAGTMGAGAYKFIEKAIGEHGEDAAKAFQGPAGALESIIRDKIIGALGDWMKKGAMSGDLEAARQSYADFFAAAMTANVTAAAAAQIEQGLRDLNAEARAKNCPEVAIPDHVFHTFGLGQFGEGAFGGQKGPTLRSHSLESGIDRTWDLFANVGDPKGLPF